MTDADYIVELQNVTKQFGSGFTAVQQLSLQIRRGEFLTLLGASGCGKTTTLRMIGGLETVSSGAIYIDGREVTHTPPYDRHVSLVFQDYALFPHLTVEENIAFGLKMRGISRTQRLLQARDMLEFVQLPHVAKRKPHQISGGQRQRVALARSLVLQPTVLLLDEPLGALDAELRRQMQLELKRIQTQVGITFIYVTHDQQEALTMSDRIVVMRHGKIEQMGTPQEIYDRPQTPFVAQFMGQCNLRYAQVISFDQTTVSVLDPVFGPLRVRRDRTVPLSPQQSVVVMIRPERMHISLQRPPQINSVQGILNAQIYAGSVTRFVVQVDHDEIIVESAMRSPLEVGSPVYIGWDVDDAIALSDGHSTPALSYV
ncbi:ABC transporter ATP-binding protein [Oscillatoria sp. FACHB-1407]|uniref:ABC transporter ATP-binding protein n=1 Tax=Oscillatoria sp. FACHB-1407 TaxID=2692847 RepID=UPI001684FADE|nr:ABC transporter ATP-binding protein [Oscillatoria sp. FACHB-1407]MBD2459723.1 ABC transporter ATP-binding protein [Oscillatoria sp. FACHB-1407]